MKNNVPCDLLMVIAKAGLTGNCLLCHSKGNSLALGKKMILGMKTILEVPASRHCSTLNMNKMLSNRYGIDNFI